MARSGSQFGAGGAGINNPPPIDPAATGPVATLRTGIKGSLTWSKLSGSSALSIAASTGVVSISTALGAGNTVSATFRVQNTAGDAIEKTLTLKAALIAPTLQALTADPATGTVSSALESAISGKTANSQLSLTGKGAAGLSITGTTITGTPTADGPVNIVETLDGATNSPRTTPAVLSIAAAPIAGEREWLAGDQLSWPTDIAPATTADNTFMAVAITMEAHPWAGRSPSFCLHNYYRSSSTAGESVAPGSFTYEAIYVELKDGTLRQLFVDGSPTLGFTGGTGKWKWTDNDTTIPLSANERYRLWLAIAAPVGAQLPTKGKPVVPVSQFATETGAGDVFASGSTSFATAIANKQFPVSQPAGTFVVAAPCMATIMGVNDGRDVALLTGDSLVRYHHMYAGYGSRNMRGNFGYGYALADPTNGRIPYGCLSASSTRPSNLSASGFAARKAMLAAKNWPFNVILNEMAGNGLASSYKSDFDAMWAFLKTLTADTPKPIGQVTIPPRPSLNSTSGGTTLTGQTADVTATRDGANEYILSQPGSGITFVIDMNKTIEDAAGVRGKMPVPGFTTNLAAAANVGDTVLSLVAAPKEGDFLSIGVGSSTNEDVFVNTVTGTGPYTVTIQNAGQYTGGIKTARAANVAVGGQASIDGTHYSTQQLIDVMAPFLVANKANGKFTGRTTPAPNVSLSSAQSKSEGNAGTTTAFTYTITRSISTGSVSVPWTLAYGSADASDFDPSQPTSGTVTISEGATTAVVTILVKGDNTVEGDDTFTLSITAPAGYISGAAMSANGTILNDDASTPSPELPTTNQVFNLDFSNMSMMFTDSGRQTPVTAGDQVVLSLTDQGSAASHPTGRGTYRSGMFGAKGGIEYNGTSDYFISAVAALSAAFSGTGVPFVVYFVEKILKLPTATAAPWALVGTGFHRDSHSTSGNKSVGKRNDAGSSQSVITATADNPAIGDVVVWAFRHNSNGSGDIFKNGTLVKSSTSIVTGATSVSKLVLGASVATGSGTTAAERFWPGGHGQVAGYTGTYTNDNIAENSAILRGKFTAAA